MVNMVVQSTRGLLNVYGCCSALLITMRCLLPLFLFTVIAVSNDVEQLSTPAVSKKPQQGKSRPLNLLGGRGMWRGGG